MCVAAWFSSRFVPESGLKSRLPGVASLQAHARASVVAGPMDMQALQGMTRPQNDQWTTWQPKAPGAKQQPYGHQTQCFGTQ